MQLTIIIPILNEAAIIGETLHSLLAHITSAGKRDDIEVIVVDGGSCDESVSVAESYADKVLMSEPGRASQMNAGAAVATGDYLLFLHVDTLLPDNFFYITPLFDQQTVWGFFTIRLSGDNWCYRIIENGIRLRSRLTRVATGDQCLYVKRSTFHTIGGFAPITLMEDVEISKRLRRLAAPAIVRQIVTTSSRRWQTRGVLKTVLFMWWLRWCYFIGVAPAKLASRYYGSRDDANHSK